MEEDSRIETNYRAQHVEDIDSEDETAEVKDVGEKQEYMEVESTEKKSEEGEAKNTEMTVSVETKAEECEAVNRGDAAEVGCYSVLYVNTFMNTMSII